jgi:hypothetical protein
MISSCALVGKCSFNYREGVVWYSRRSVQVRQADIWSGGILNVTLMFVNVDSPSCGNGFLYPKAKYDKRRIIRRTVSSFLVYTSCTLLGYADWCNSAHS